MRYSSLAALSLILAATTAPALAAPATTVAAALKASDRRPDNVKLDEGRKPAAVLQYLGFKPGLQVLDLFGANGYWAEIMVPALGPKGHDTIWQPTQFFGARGKAYMDGFVAKHPNVNVITSPFEAPDLPKNYADFVMLNNNYHDTYWASEQQQAVRLAAYYEVRLVQLEPEAPRTVAAPVLTVGQWVGPKPAAELLASHSAIRFARPAAIGSSLPDRIEISPARSFLDLPPVNPSFADDNRFWLSGTGFRGGIRRRLIISHPDFAGLGLPRGEIALGEAPPPIAAADARWGVSIESDRIDVAVCQRLANPLGGPDIALMPGQYSARLDLVIADQPVGPDMREIVRKSNSVPFQIAPRIRDAQPPVLIPGNPGDPPPADEDRQRITIRLAPTFTLTAAKSVEIAIDGAPYRRVTNFTAIPAENDNCFRCLANSLVVQPPFDVTLPDGFSLGDHQAEFEAASKQAGWTIERDGPTIIVRDVWTENEDHAAWLVATKAGLSPERVTVWTGRE